LQWFDLDHLGRSAAQFDEAKLRWVNAQHIKTADNADLVQRLQPFLSERGVQMHRERAVAACALFKDRCSTLIELADWLLLLVRGGRASDEDRVKHLGPAGVAALAHLAQALVPVPWTRTDIAAALAQVLKDLQLKMPQLAVPARVALLGTAQTPSLDAVLELMDRDEVLHRLRNPLAP
jgi:glutamyl-tRNA synthetase